MFFPKTARVFCKDIFSSHFVTSRVLLQSSNFTLRNSRSDLFRSLPYANSSSSHHTPSEESTLPSILNKIVKYSIRQVPAALITNLIIASIALFIPADLLYAWHQNRYNERLLNETIEKGTRPKINVMTNKFVPRPVILERLKKILQPDKDTSNYYMVCGEDGTGKTTLTKIVSKEAKQGVIYINIQGSDNKKSDALEDFGVAFGKALNFTFEEHVAFSKKFIKKILGDVNEKSNQEKWKRAFDTFKRISAVYRAKHGKPPVIIYDNINRLIPEYSNILDFLQDDAKDNADDREYIAVFVCSDGSVPRRMRMRSAWSRAKPVIEIGDLSEKESMQYLIDKRKIKEDDAKKLYELVGGRIVTLKSVADDFIAGQSFENIKAIVFNDIYNNFEKAKINPNQKNHKMAKIIIKALLNSKNVLHISMLRELTKMEPDEFLENNIFAYHPRDMTVTFQSRSTERYIRENADKFIK
ncbi:hypothetical protein Glove_707g40 [Diversispora epigaea]|uniref:AAA+ ATPase domain-containing protein n=1 Tax=Diversispora epigaea TaxID=1348612 RepID=A0A397G1I5_9GLOM|nr:hypothetical protein Glove_707g40 [Diversispora epigaea]